MKAAAESCVCLREAIRDLSAVKPVESALQKDPTQRDFKVSEHFGTNSVGKLPPPMGQNTLILEKWRPPGKSNNLRVTSRLLPLNIRDPVNFWEAGRSFHLSAFPSHKI